MGTFSPVHWIIAAALLSALVAFVWLAGSFIVAGLRSDEHRRKTVVFLVLLPFVALALYAAVVTNSDKQELKPFVGSLDGEKMGRSEDGPWVEYQNNR